jgi:hypothetical protein
MEIVDVSFFGFCLANACFEASQVVETKTKPWQWYGRSDELFCLEVKGNLSEVVSGLGAKLGSNGTNYLRIQRCAPKVVCPR